MSADAITRFVADAGAHGVYLKWFGGPRTIGFTGRYDQWGYAPSDGALPRLIVL